MSPITDTLADLRYQVGMGYISYGEYIARLRVLLGVQRSTSYDRRHRWTTSCR